MICDCSNLECEGCECERRGDGEKWSNHVSPPCCAFVAMDETPTACVVMSRGRDAVVKASGANAIEGGDAPSPSACSLTSQSPFLA